VLAVVTEAGIGIVSQYSIETSDNRYERVGCADFSPAFHLLQRLESSMSPFFRLLTSISKHLNRRSSAVVAQSGQRHRTQNIFVVREIALALVLLVGAGLMIRSLAAVWKIDPGFDYHHVLTAHVSFPPSISTPDATRAMWRQMDEQLRSVPGLKAVSLSVGATPMGNDNEIPFWVEGQPKPPNQTEMNWSITYFVQPDYLEVMKVPLKRGRFLTPQDNEHSLLVTVIDGQFARRYFGDRNPEWSKYSNALRDHGFL